MALIFLQKRARIVRESTPAVLRRKKPGPEKA
jgi:hypothetical protein